MLPRYTKAFFVKQRDNQLDGFILYAFDDAFNHPLHKRLQPSAIYLTDDVFQHISLNFGLHFSFEFVKLFRHFRNISTTLFCYFQRMGFVFQLTTDTVNVFRRVSDN